MAQPQKEAIMKLSMSLLAWYLRDHRPISHIQDDSVCIQGLRFVMDDVEEMQPEYVYFGAGSYFFTAPQYAGAYLAVNQHSILIFIDADYNALLNGLLSAFDFFNNWELTLLDAGSRHAPLKEFVDIAAPVLGNPFSIVNLDMSFRVNSDLAGHRTDPLWNRIAWEDTMVLHPAMYKPYFNTRGEKIQDLSERPQLVRNVYDGGDPVMMLYLRQGAEVVGCMAILQENGTLTEQNFQLAPIFARFCRNAEEFVSDSGAIQSGAAMFLNLLDGRDVGELNLRRLERLLPSPLWRLLAIRASNRTDQLALRGLLANLRKQQEYYLPTERQGICFCIAADAKLRDMPLFPEVAAGASIPFSDLSTLPTRRQQAEFALEQSNGVHGLFLCEGYACNYLLRTFRSLELVATLLHPALEALERYDVENRSELRKTLSVYLQQERNQLFSAKVLHIHPNTMRYRLQRIMDITGLTLEDPEELKYLRLSDWLEE